MAAAAPRHAPLQSGCAPCALAPAAAAPAPQREAPLALSRPTAGSSIGPWCEGSGAKAARAAAAAAGEDGPLRERYNPKLRVSANVLDCAFKPFKLCPPCSALAGNERAAFGLITNGCNSRRRLGNSVEHRGLKGCVDVSLAATRRPRWRRRDATCVQRAQPLHSCSFPAAGNRHYIIWRSALGLRPAGTV